MKPSKRARKTATGILEIETGLGSRNEKKRWAAAAAAGELIPSQPGVVWKLILRFGSSPISDVRNAVATCMLEHLLEVRFGKYFPLLEAEIRSGNFILGDTFDRCWKFGLAKKPANATKWDRLVEFSQKALGRKSRKPINK